jgi:AraC family transcriptional regulator of arabinose operon
MPDRIMSKPDLPFPPVNPIVGDTNFYNSVECFRRNGIPAWQLMCSRTGTYQLTLPSGHRIQPASRDVVLIAPGVRHDFGTCEGWTVSWACFHPKADWLELLDLPQLEPGLSVLPVSRPLFAIVTRQLDQLIAELHAGGPLAARLAQNALEAGLLRLAAGVRAAHQDPRLARATAQFAAHLDRTLPLDSVARVAGCSRAQLTRLFRRDLGLSPTRWHEQQRLERARVLLATTDQGVAEIAARLGFASPFHFARRYRRHTGHPPSHGRRVAAVDAPGRFPGQ